MKTNHPRIDLDVNFRKTLFQKFNQSSTKSLMKELRNTQLHDPDIIPAAGGGYVKMLKDEAGNVLGVRPAAEAETQPRLSTHLGQLINEKLSSEDIEMKMIGLMKKIALNPAVTMVHTYVTYTKGPDWETVLNNRDFSDMHRPVAY